MLSSSNSMFRTHFTRSESNGLRERYLPCSSPFCPPLTYWHSCALVITDSKCVFIDYAVKQKADEKKSSGVSVGRDNLHPLHNTSQPKQCLYNIPFILYVFTSNSLLGMPFILLSLSTCIQICILLKVTDFLRCYDKLFLLLNNTPSSKIREILVVSNINAAAGYVADILAVQSHNVPNPLIVTGYDVWSI